MFAWWMIVCGWMWMWVFATVIEGKSGSPDGSAAGKYFGGEYSDDRYVADILCLEVAPAVYIYIAVRISNGRTLR